jgi:L-amino acid N-acyltransferase YncA
MTTLPNIKAYPKTIMLNDGTPVAVRPLEPGDKVRLLQFFQRVPEEERHYLKENVAAPEVVHGWTTQIDFDRVLPIVALVGDEIVADATLHRSRAMARRHVGELRVVVDPSYREVGLGRRLLRELLDIAAELGLHQATFELVADREESAIRAAISVGFRQVGVLKERIRDFWGNYQDLVLLELPLKDRELWWRF